MTSTADSTPLPLTRDGVGRIMNSVLLALLPGALVQAWVLGSDTLWHALFAMAIAVAAESLALRLRGQSMAAFLRDSSALVTAALLALLLPVTLPLWLLALAVVVAVLAGKHLYGGLGENVFNPAMLGLAIVPVLFPDGLAPIETAAGPAALIACAYALGGVFLLLRKTIAWHSPVAMLGAALLAMIALGSGRTAVASLFSWPMVLAAFFVATDPVTGAMGARGRTIFAAGTGFLVAAASTVGSEIAAAIPFAVLSMNAIAPWLDLRTRRRVAAAPART